MPCFKFTSLKDLMEGWLVRQKDYKAKEKNFFKEEHPVESGICFGHLVAIGECLEDLVGLIDHLQRQARDAYEALLLTRLKYKSDVPSQGEIPYDSSNAGKIDEQSQTFFSSSIRKE